MSANLAECRLPTPHQRLLDKAAVLAMRSEKKACAISPGLSRRLREGREIPPPGREMRIGSSRFGTLYLHRWAGVDYIEICHNATINYPDLSTANIAVILPAEGNRWEVVDPDGNVVKHCEGSLGQPLLFVEVAALAYCRRKGWDYIRP